MADLWFDMYGIKGDKRGGDSWRLEDVYEPVRIEDVGVLNNSFK